MKVRLIVGLVVFGLIAVMLMAVSGCSGTSGGSSKVVVVGDICTGGTETISGTVTVEVSGSSGTISLNLNPVLVSGEGLVLTVSNVNVLMGTSLTDLATAEFTLPTVSDKPVDIAFILDNTGSMRNVITGSKNSINAFAASLEAQGKDVRFGLVTFGDSPKHPTPTGLITDEGTPSYTDCSYTREVAALGTAAALEIVLASTEADGGGDLAENPLDAIMYAYNNFAWRADAQKIIIVITDIYAHQITDTYGKSFGGGNRCTTSGEAVVADLSGKATIYCVSPAYSYALSYGLLDVRRLADGLGEDRATAETNTGGKWIEFEDTGFDLTTLGIDTVIERSYTVRSSYTFDSGTYYIKLQIDTDGDGIFDSYLLITLSVSTSTASISNVVLSKEFGEPIKLNTVVYKNPNPIPKPNK